MKSGLFSIVKNKALQPAVCLLLGIFLCVSAACPARADEILAGPGAEKPNPPEAKAGLTPAPFSISVRFDSSLEILTEKNTLGWRMRASDGTYQWDDDKVSEYFEELKEKYDTPAGTVNFKTHEGVMMQFKSDACGWHLNTDMSVKNLEKAVDDGESVTDPAWNSGLVYSENSEVGDKYVEISISEQKVYLFEDGDEIFSTDCVTGLEGVSDTERGVYQVIYKASPSTLKDVDRNGNKYEQPVSYWIDFNGSQGMHDATWRSQFGGEIYKTNGSHGCVNLPLDAAKTIYGEVYTYYPVIVY